MHWDDMRRTENRTFSTLENLMQCQGSRTLGSLGWSTVTPSWASQVREPWKLQVWGWDPGVLTSQVEFITGRHCSLLLRLTTATEGSLSFQGFLGRMHPSSGIWKIKTLWYWSLVLKLLKLFTSLKDLINFENCSKIFIEQVKEKYKTVVEVKFWHD